jgi:hypothetical protein
MKIIWINPASVYEYKGGLTSQRACVRLRCIEPANFLTRKGHSVLLANMTNWQGWINDPAFYNADFYIIGKVIIDLSSVIQRLRSLDRKIIIDVCDNFYEPPEDSLRKKYESILPLVDKIIVASKELEKALKIRIDKPITVIPDHVEGLKLTPYFKPEKNKIKLLWFGYPSNLNSLNDFLPQLSILKDEVQVTLSIVTNWSNYLLDYFKDGRNGINIKHVNWSLENMSQELNNCNLVIIPGASNPAGITKTANRVLTSLYAGRYVVAYPLPAYLEFLQFISIGENLVEGIRFSLKNRDIIIQRIADGQIYIEKNYSPEVISQLWETALMDER